MEVEICDLEPIGGTVWKATVAVLIPELIEGLDCAQATRVTVRFSYPDDGPVHGLIEAAVLKAKDSFPLAASHLASLAPGQFLANVREQRASLDVEFAPLSD